MRAVRNEYGTDDIWVRLVSWFVRNTGPSGYYGFQCEHKMLIQRLHSYTHSAYFGKGHMRHGWVPFIEKELYEIPVEQNDGAPEKVDGFWNQKHPWGFYLGYIVVGIVVYCVF